MAAYNDDLEALKTWADPRIPHSEKIALLGMGPPLSSSAVAQLGPVKAGPSDTASDAPRQVPGLGGVDDAILAAAHHREPIGPAAPPGVHQTPPQVVPIKNGARDLATESDEILARAQPAPGNAPPVEADAPTQVAAAADDPRLALMAWRDAGSAAKPVQTERVQEELQVQRGTLSPADIGAYEQARKEADDAAVKSAEYQSDLENQQQAAQLRAMEAVQAERADLEKIRTIGMQRTQDLIARQDQISREIAAMDPVSPSLYAGKNFGESLVTALSLMAFGAGAGATGTSAEIVPMAQSLARREVDKQAALIMAKKGQIDAFGSILERHMANLKDIDLAKRATMADIMGLSELQSAQLAQRSSSEMTKQKLTQQAAALKAARMQEVAQLQQALGDKVMQQTSLAYVRARQQQQPAAPVQSPAQPALTGEELDAAPPALAVAKGAPAASAEKGSKEEIGRAIVGGSKLWQQGQHGEALRQLPPTVQQAVQSQAQRLLKGKSLGEGATPEEATAWALSSLLGWPVPKKMILSGARDRMVTLPDGRFGFVAAPGQVLKRQEELNSDSALIGAYNRLLSIANKPGAKLSPDDLTEIRTLSELIRPNLNVSLGGGAMAEFENELLKGPSGGDINSVQDWLLGTGKKAAETALGLVKGRLRARLSGISKSPFDVDPISASGGVR